MELRAVNLAGRFSSVDELGNDSGAEGSRFVMIREALGWDRKSFIPAATGRLFFGRYAQVGNGGTGRAVQLVDIRDAGNVVVERNMGSDMHWPFDFHQLGDRKRG